MKLKSFITILTSLLAASFATSASTIDDYCDPPLKLARLEPPSDLTLRQVQIVTRHGDRTPTSSLPLSPVPWDCSPLTETIHTLIGSEATVRQETTGPFSFPPGCTKGQLTQKGHDQHLELGTAARERYINKHGVMPSVLTPGNMDRLYFRSTAASRTMQSGQAFLSGLYPDSKRSHSPALTMHIADIDNMQAGTHCPRLTRLASGYAESTRYKTLVTTNKKLVRSVGRKMGTWSDDHVQSSFASTVMKSDVLFSRACHDKAQPEGITSQEVSAMRRVLDAFLAGSTTFDLPNTEVARLAIGPFLKDIVVNLQLAAAGKQAPAIGLYSGHDTTIWPLLATLSQDNDVLVPYASHLGFELWEDQSAGFWVAVDFNGGYLKLPGCKSEFCDLQDFVSSLAGYIPEDYHRECHAL